jgi:hypothetical protein
MKTVTVLACGLALLSAAAPGPALALADSPAHVAAAGDPLIGIWRFETTSGPALKGDLTIARHGSTWHATLSGARATFQAAAHTVRFAFPGQLGRFRGALTDKERAIDGFWIRPGATVDPRYPVGSGQAFATPLVLKRSARNVWRGTVRPLQDSFTLFLRVFRSDEGALVGAFRNPDQNSHGGAMQFRVSRAGDAVRFSVQPNPAAPEMRHEAQLVNGKALQLFWPDLDRVIELRRCTPSQAAAFFPRPPGEPAYRYRRPAATGDGWSTARAREVGIDEDALTRLIRKLINADPAARRPSLIHSSLVARRGKLVLEEYFFGFHRDTPHDVRSAGKTFASVLLGAAMRQGVPIAPETKVYDLLAGMGPFANPDPRKSQITLAHLMTHTAGFACNDNDDASAGNEGTMQSQRQQPNWWKYTQVLLVIPELELAVVFTGGNYRQGGIWGRWGNEIVGGEIVPAIRR